MRNILIATAFAAATLVSPVVLVLSGPASAIDCSDPASPGNRPGGYCAQSIGAGDSLSDPVTTTPPIVEVCPTDFIVPQTKGKRVHVAAECDYDPCDDFAAIELPTKAGDRIRVAQPTCSE